MNDTHVKTQQSSKTLYMCNNKNFDIIEFQLYVLTYAVYCCMLKVHLLL